MHLGVDARRDEICQTFCSWIKTGVAPRRSCTRASGDWSISDLLLVLSSIAEILISRAPLIVLNAACSEITLMKIRMDKTLRFWVDVACDEIKLDHIELTRSQLVAQILRQYERRGYAMRYLDASGKIDWKASPRFLTMLADAERETQDDLADFP
jgi:hypothetical protein